MKPLATLLSLIVLGLGATTAWAEEDETSVVEATSPDPSLWYGAGAARPRAAARFVAPRTPGEGWIALADQRLDEVRGGFIDASGLQVSFGIERAIYLNGELVTTTRLNVADLAALSGGKAGATLTGGAALLQNGPGNLIDSGTLSPSSLATVIQNSLNGQHIRSVTTVNATVNSLGILKSIDLQHSVRGALTDALRR